MQLRPSHLHRLTVQVDDYTLSRLELLRNPDRSVAKARARALALFSALVPLFSRRSLRVEREKGLAGLAQQLRLREELLTDLLERFYDHT